jgi:hypothetical protein
MTTDQELVECWINGNRSWVAIKRSLSADKRKRAVRKVRSGYGHLGDLY